MLLYVVLALLALAMPGTSAGVWSLRILLLLAVVHAIEVAVFWDYENTPLPREVRPAEAAKSAKAMLKDFTEVSFLSFSSG